MAIWWKSIFMILITPQQIMLVIHGLHPEVLLNFEERAKLHGYPVEIHPVVTEDDYMLNMFRIPHGLEKVQVEPKNKSAILLVHGMGGSLHNFIALGKEYAPAYYFANRSFDVWLCCVRGGDCQNPRKHRKYDWNRDDEYWNFSLHEIGIYDMPACIDHVLKVTGQQKIFYVGHSAGGAEFLIMASERPDYNKKIKINTNYGQASFMKYLDYPSLSCTAAIVGIFKNRINNLGVYELISYHAHNLAVSLGRKACADPWYRKRLCYNLIPGIMGSYKTTLIEEDIVEIIFSNVPRMSIRQVVQYADNIITGDFRQYDWGPKENMRMYKQKIPPHYNISACTCPTAFFYGTTDSFSTPNDNLLTMKMLPNIILDYEISPRFAHLDFLFAKNATYMLYEKTVKLFKDFDEGKIPARIIRTRRTYNELIKNK